MSPSALLLLWLLPVHSAHDILHIGGLFERENTTEEAAFLSAVRYVNRHQLIGGRTLSPLVRHVSEHDSFQVQRALCELVEEGVVAVLGPRSPTTSRHVQSLCDALEVPHLTARWDHSQRRSSCLVNLHPHPSALSKALAEIVRAWDWSGFTVLYDDYEALIKIQELVKMADDRGYLVTVRQLTYEPEYGYRTVLQDIKYSEERNLVVECRTEILEEVLTQAQQVGLMGREYSYIIASLDFQTIDYSPFKWSRTNITIIRLVNPDRAEVREAAARWREEPGEEEGDYYFGDYSDGPQSEPPPPNTSHPTPPIVIPNVEAALTHDAVVLLAGALDQLGPTPVPPLYCHRQGSFFKYGYSIVNYIRLSEVAGLTGRVRFDQEGFRRELELEVLELRQEGLRAKGSWNGSLSLLPPVLAPPYPHDGEDLSNVTFTVLIALTRPYNMLRENSSPLTGNDRYEGFGVELIHELSLMSGFNYTFKEHSDKTSGNPTTHPNGSRTWDGMIGEVLAGRADIAIADITITDERNKDADFTDPFMTLGISILHRKPTKAPASLFTFMSPFSSEVWAYMMSAYVGVSLLLFVMARISPYEWTNPYPCLEEPDALENQFSMNNAFWFTVGSLMQQGSDVAPIAASTRLVAAIWWFFTLIMVSSYTAQLASFLTIETPVQPFKSVEELANQNVIKYGAKDKGSTANFFRDSHDPIYQKIYKAMTADKKLMPRNNDAGVRRVLEEKNYAFFMESTSIEYEVERKCDLAQVGGLLDHKGYGIVMRQNSTYRNVLSKHIVQLQEKGKLSVMKDKWWKEKRGGGACKKEGEKSEGSELSLDHTGGVFVVLLGGCLVGVSVAFCEVFWHIYHRQNKVSYRAELAEELKFILACRQGVKPVRVMSVDLPSRQSTLTN